MSLDLDYQRHLFDHYSKDPAKWLSQADKLKWAADRVCWLDENGNEIEAYPDRMHLAFTIGTYRMLLGLAFEYLLKGIAIAQDRVIVKGDRLDSFIATHSLAKLIKLVDVSDAALTKEEIDMLEGLQPYIEWCGRYPIPKRASEFQLSEHGNYEHRLEREAYRKLFEYLGSIGWIRQADGSKLMIRDIQEMKANKMLESDA